MMLTFDGHHGTSFESSQLILQNNYELSLGDEEWLGDGAYFFVRGINTKTAELAEKWAIAQAWDNNKKVLSYREYCVLHSEINVDEKEFLDLTVEDGVEILNYLVEQFEDKIRTTGRKIRKVYYDGLLLNLAREEGILPLEAVKGNFYIKFAKERVERINLRTSNCTICAVYNPSKIVSSIKIVKRGAIK